MDWIGPLRGMFFCLLCFMSLLEKKTPQSCSMAIFSLQDIQEVNSFSIHTGIYNSIAWRQYGGQVRIVFIAVFQTISVKGKNK